MAGCKCPGSCACKIKKPRKPKVKKAVIGGRVKQPQVVIQGMPPVSTTAIPAGYPYLTVTSDAAQKRSMTTQTEIQAQPEVKKEKQEVKEEPLRELKGDSLFLSLPSKTPSQQLSLLKSKIAAGTTKQFPVLRATTGTQAGPSVTTTGIQAGPSMATTEVQTEAPTRMTTAAQTNLIEHVGVGTQTSMKIRSPEEIAKIAREQKQFGIMAGYKQGRAREAALRTKETKEMGTETEPLLVTVAKGAKADIFSIMKEQEATGKTLSLTGAGRPARPFNQSVALASPSLSPVRPTPAVPVGSASSSSAVPGYTIITKPSTGTVIDPKTGLKYDYSYPGGQVKQMPVNEVIDLS